MTPFPIVNERVQLSTDPVDPTDAFLAGLRLKADDSAVRAAISGGAYTNAGRLFTATGQLVYVDASAGLPANTTFVNGLPFAPTGELCVSSGAVASYSNGVPMVANGAVCATFGTLQQQFAGFMASLSSPKVWYDFSDASSLFQDSAGTVPVTTAGNPIGKVLDKSGAANHMIQAVAGSCPLWQTTFSALDGVDDSWGTAANVNFTSTDEVTVIAGVRKLSDAADAVITELSTTNANNGMFYIKAPGSATATKFEFLSRGVGTQAVPFTSSVTYNSPVSVVATGVSKINTPSALLRINGVQVDIKTPSQGGGNFGTYPLFVGRRNNTSMPFNGNIYGLVIIGRLLTAPELTLCEQYMAGQVGISF